MNARLVFACVAAGIALTAFAAAPAGADAAGPLAAEIAQEQPTTSPAEPPADQPDTSPAEPPAEPPTTQPAPPQVPVTPNGAADTGSLDPAPRQGPDAGVVALGGMALLAAGGLGVAVHRRRQRA